MVCCWCGLEVKLNLLSPEASLDKSFGPSSLWPDPLLWFPSSASICGSHVTDWHCRSLVAQNWTTSLQPSLPAVSLHQFVFVYFKIQLSVHDTVKVIFSLFFKKTIKIVSGLYWHSAFWNKIIEGPFSASYGGAGDGLALGWLWGRPWAARAWWVESRGLELMAMLSQAAVLVQRGEQLRWSAVGAAPLPPHVIIQSWGSLVWYGTPSCVFSVLPT